MSLKKYGLRSNQRGNGNPWGNSKLLPHTALTVWLMQLGVRVTHSRPHHPQTMANVNAFMYLKMI